MPPPFVADFISNIADIARRGVKNAKTTLVLRRGEPPTGSIVSTTGNAPAPREVSILKLELNINH